MTLRSTDYALLSQDSYNDPIVDKRTTLDGVAYKVIDHVDNPRNGFQATAYERMDTHEIVIAYRGTEFDREPKQDGMTDAGMALDGVNAQTADAMAFTQRVMETAKQRAETNNYLLNVTVTGHSLGGTLAEILAYKYGLRGETFNAFGAAGLMKGIPEGGNQVIDHVRAADVVSAASRHFGTVRTYAVQQDIDALSRSGYHDSAVLNAFTPHAPVLGIIQKDAHAIDNFVPDSQLLGHSIISTENEKRSGAHRNMIGRYRGDIQDARDIAFFGYQTQKPFIEGAEVIVHAGQHAAHEAVHAYTAAREKVVQGIHVTEHIADVVANETSHAYDATRKDVVQGMHTVEHAISQGVHAAEHGVSQGLHATQHAAHTVSNDTSKTWNTLSHPGSWFGDSPTAQATPQRLDHPSHPDHAFYQQARSAVHRLDAEHHRVPDQHSDNLAAALVVAARCAGLSQIDHVALSDDASRTFAVQGEFHSPLRQFTQVPTAQAANTAIEQSSLVWQQAAPSKQADQLQAQQFISQQHEQQLQRTPHPIGL